MRVVLITKKFKEKQQRKHQLLSKIPKLSDYFTKAGDEVDEQQVDQSLAHDGVDENTASLILG